MYARSWASYTLGHAGVVVPRDDGWLLQADDAHFFHTEMDLLHPRCTPGLRFCQWMMEKDRRARQENQRRLRELRRRERGKIEICCGHDVTEFERLPGRSARVPAEAMAGRSHVVTRVEVPQPGKTYH